jgi:hypothetical protein
VAPGIDTEFWYYGSAPALLGLSFLNWTLAVLSDEQPPLVHSLSYGLAGTSSLLAAVPLAELETIEANFAKFAGTSISRYSFIK